MSKDDHPIRNKIIASVVAGLVLSTLGYAFYAAPDIFRWVSRILTSIWNHLTSALTLPYWLFWLIVILSVPTMIRVIRSLTRRDKTDEPTFRMYTQDSFEGIIWRWSYDYYGSPSNITPYCPICDSQLVHLRETEFSLRRASSVAFYCETCKQEQARIEGGDRHYAISMVQRFIDLKIRHGEWEQRIRRDGLIEEKS